MKSQVPACPAIPKYSRVRALHLSWASELYLGLEATPSAHSKALDRERGSEVATCVQVEFWLD